MGVITKWGKLFLWDTLRPNRLFFGKMGVKLKKRVTFPKYFTDNRNYCGK
jgi:hypothetical protein